MKLKPSKNHPWRKFKIASVLDKSERDFIRVIKEMRINEYFKKRY
jgi:hypothetical protein